MFAGQGRRSLLKGTPRKGEGKELVSDRKKPTLRTGLGGLVSDGSSIGSDNNRMKGYRRGCHGQAKVAQESRKKGGGGTGQEGVADEKNAVYSWGKRSTVGGGGREETNKRKKRL